MAAIAQRAEASVETVAIAAERLRAGRLVAFPTETVYGLGADATQDAAVARIFEAKQRPSFNPLICHFPSTDAVCAMFPFPEPAARLADAFWPGSLSMVLPRPAGCPISKLACAGLETVAVRVPNHAMAQSLLSDVGVPVAAPSANRSGRLSPTRAEHVMQSLSDSDVFVLDGGRCAVGVESSVVGFEADGSVSLLREGGISREDILQRTGIEVVYFDAVDEGRSPGRLTRHYQPTKPLRLNVEQPTEDELYLGFGPLPPDLSNKAMTLSERADLTEAAANLFSMLHDLETQDGSSIAVAPIPETGLGRAINDRLQRGAI